MLEVLSDTGLGKEMHSVISQGRVESIVNSKPVDRTALIEEAAGLTKHRKRRHRAQLKLNRTQDNLDRALDVEREARSHLRPLKRQAEAAELHTRLERQSLEARDALVTDDLRIVRAELAVVTQARRGGARDARRHRHRAGRRRTFPRGVRAQAGRARPRARAARDARVRLALGGGPDLAAARVGRARDRRRCARAWSARERALLPLREQLEQESDPGAGRLGELEAELEQLEQERASRLDAELAGLESERTEAQRRIEELTANCETANGELEQAEAGVTEARARRQAATEFVELAARARGAVAERLEEARERARLARQDGGAESLAARLDVEPGYEAAVVRSARRPAARARRGRVFPKARAPSRELGDGGRARARAPRPPRERGRTLHPSPARERLLDRVRPAAEVADLVGALARRRLDRGAARRPAGGLRAASRSRATAWRTSRGSARCAVCRAGAGGRDLAARNRLADLEAELGARGLRARAGPRGRRAKPPRPSQRAEEQRDATESRLRDVRREQQQAEEEERRLAWLVRAAPRACDREPTTLAGRSVAAEIAAERRVADRLEQERRERVARVDALERSLQQDRALLPHAERARRSHCARRSRQRSRGARASTSELSADEARSERLRGASCASLRGASTTCRAACARPARRSPRRRCASAQVRDREQHVAAEVAEIGRRLGIEGDGERSAAGARPKRSGPSSRRGSSAWSAGASASAP